MPTAPTDADPAHFTEPLWPSPGVWLATIGFGAALGLIPAPVSTTAAVVTSVICIVVFVTLLLLWTPRLIVTEHDLVAGLARMPLTVVADVQSLDAVAMRQSRGPGLDARAFLCLRGWLNEGVRVVLQDPEDPTPYWLLSSRRPDAVAQAVRAGLRRTQQTD